MSNMTGKWIPSSINNKIHITKYWLAGFIDGDATFSTNKVIPRFKLENHIKELELYNKINEYLQIGKVLYTSDRSEKIGRSNGSPTIILEINKIKDLKFNLIPLMYENNSIILKSSKVKDFLLWIKLVDIYYQGYHLTVEGKYLFEAIKLHMNKYRLSTNENLLKDKTRISLKEINVLQKKLYLLESPYEIKNSIRFIRNTDNLVSEGTQIVVIDEKNSRETYNSLTECSKNLKIDRSTIKKYLMTGKIFKGYTFVLE